MEWLSIEEAAKKLNITAHAVRKRVSTGKMANYRYVDGHGRGGKVLEIHMSEFPELFSSEEAVIDEKASTTSKKAYFTKEQREKGEVKATLLYQYKQFEQKCKRSGISTKKEIKNLFLLEWNSKNECKISLATLYRYLEDFGCMKPEAFIDKRGGHNRGITTIPDDIWNRFQQLYLRETKPTAKMCYQIVKMELQSNGVEIPSLRSFERRINELPLAILIRGREGEKAFEDLCVPTAERDYVNINSNRLWVSDHHVWDIHVSVKDGDTYRLVRPWGTYWMDMKSRYVTSSLLRTQSPNSNGVLIAFTEGVKTFGIPEEVYLDNGADYKSGDMFNDKKLQEKFGSLSSLMGIKVHYAIPYNAKAKPIERMFNTFEQQFGKMFNSYLGRNSVERPKDLAKLGLEQYPTFEEFIEIHDRYIREFYHKAPHSGNGMNNKTPETVYSENLVVKRTASNDVLDMWLMRTINKPRTVHKNGVTINGVRYFSDEVVKYIGTKVYVRHKPDDMSYVHLHDLEGNYLFTAIKKELMSFSPSAADYKRLNETKKMARGTIRSLMPSKNTKSGTVEHIGTVLELKELENKLSDKYSMTSSTPIIMPIRNELIEKTVKEVDMTETQKRLDESNRLSEEAVDKSLTKKNALIDDLWNYYDKPKIAK